jgi:hypothetical protein
MTSLCQIRNAPRYERRASQNGGYAVRIIIVIRFTAKEPTVEITVIPP